MTEEEEKKIEKQFLRDIQDHVMTVIRDEDVNRHIRFKRPDSGTYYFDLITWSGHLIITGDCGTWVFRRVEDMFEFFCMDERDFNYKQDRLSINPDYWAEKLLAVDNNGRRRDSGPMQFSEDKFEKTIERYVENYFEDDHELSDHMKTIKEELWEEVKNSCSCPESEEDAFRMASDFHFPYLNDDGEKKVFIFGDFWEENLREWTYHYIWCLYAIVWGIKQYAEAEVNE